MKGIVGSSNTDNGTSPPAARIVLNQIYTIYPPLYRLQKVSFIAMIYKNDDLIFLSKFRNKLLVVTNMLEVAFALF